MFIVVREGNRREEKNGLLSKSFTGVIEFWEGLSS
jgi:hypothetical protein